jgi:ABC-type antimicrobial peptide transport system permease subunit
MRFSDLFKLSTRMFKARTSRTLLTILGMSVGIGAILFLVSFGYGLQKTLLERITTSDSLLTLDVSEAKNDGVILDKVSLEKIKNIPGVAEISPSFQLSSQGRLNELSADLAVFGSEPLYLKLGGTKAANGELINDNNINGVVVSSAVAQVFGVSPVDMIGKKIDLTVFVPKNTVAGSDLSGNSQSDTTKVELNNKFTVIGSIEGEDNIVYVNSKALTSLEIARYSQVKVKCKSSQELAGIRDLILNEGFLVSSVSETKAEADRIFGFIQIILLLFGSIALFVSAIGMFNTMTIALLERTEEIGIMKSIGASDGAVSTMFFMEATIMGFLGGISGIIIGWLGGVIFNGIINLIASRFGGENVNLFYSPIGLVILIVVVSAIVGALTGLAPARRASKTDPLDALRYK